MRAALPGGRLDDAAMTPGRSDEDDLDIPDVNPLYRAIGESMQAYAQVERLLASVLEAILRVDFRRAHAIFFAMQNVRTRNELIETLLNLEFGGGLRKFWASCSQYLLVLARFRNAVAHWHPHINIYVSKDEMETRAKNALGHPVLDRNLGSLEEEDFPPFLKDCFYIREQLSSLVAYVRERPATLPEELQRPLARRNQAVLRRRGKPEAQRSQPMPSRQSKRGKPSRKQRRLRALAGTAKGDN
jgi:hypothetical protein